MRLKQSGIHHEELFQNEQNKKEGTHTQKGKSPFGVDLNSFHNYLISIASFVGLRNSVVQAQAGP
jgi:hypothetical protein